ncbi:MAG: hypothetical protein AAF348_07510 [Bacteroidota bacterium]
MPNIITPSYFDNNGELSIPNAISGNAGEGINNKLSVIIAKYERRLLLEVLGVDQYNFLQLELDKLPFNPQAVTSASVEYQRLVNGFEQWEGIRPMLGYYIYCKWMESDEIKVGTVGSGKGNKQSYTIADRSSEYSDRWNDFIKTLYELEEYLKASEDLGLADGFPFYETQNSLGI